MQFTSLSFLFFTLLFLSLTAIAAPTPTETIPFNLSGRVVDKRVPRSLKHFKPQRRTPRIAAIDTRSGYGYGSNNSPNDGGAYGGHGDTHHETVNYEPKIATEIVNSGGYGDGPKGNGNTGVYGNGPAHDDGEQGHSGYGGPKYGGSTYGNGSPQPPKPSRLV